MATIAKLKKDIADMEKVVNDPSTPEADKKLIAGPLQKAKEMLADMEAKTTPAAKTPKAAPKSEPKAPRKRKTAAKKTTKAKPAAKVDDKPAPKKRKPRVRKTARKPTSGTRKLSDKAKARIAASKKRRKAQGLAYNMSEVMRDADRKANKPGRERRENRIDYATGSWPYLEKGGMTKKGLSDRAKAKIAKAKAKRKEQGLPRSTKDIMRDADRKAPKPGVEKRENRVDHAPGQWPYLERGGLFGGGKSRSKAALMKDRAYKSEEPWEKKYMRKKEPTNPRYNR